MTRRPRQSLRPLFGMAVVGFAAVALYLPALRFGLIYDSNAQVLIDDFIHQPRHLWDVLTLRVMGMDVLDFNRPVNLFTLMVDSLLWGKTPGGYHLTNLLLHGLTAALLFRWLYELVGRIAPALAAALLFAVHPLHCETVVEVGNREDLLATLFLLAGLLCATRFRPSDHEQLAAPASGAAWRGLWLPAVGVVIMFLLSIASKENGIAGPATLVVYWWALRRGERRRPWLTLLVTAATLTAAFMTLRFTLTPAHSLVFTEAPPPIASNWVDLAFVQTRIFTAEFLRIIWPSELCVDYTPYSIRNVWASLALPCLATLIFFQCYFSANGRRKGLVAVASALFWFSLLPVANIIPIYRAMADRFLYMPMAGVALVVAVALVALPEPPTGRRWYALQTYGLGAAYAATVLLAMVTWRQEQVWRDPASLWIATIQRNPFSIAGWMGYGYVALERHQPDAAMDAFKRASTLAQQSQAEPFAGMALAADAQGRYQQASEAFARAAALDPRFAKPDDLLRGLVLEPEYVARLKVIAARPAPQP